MADEEMRERTRLRAAILDMDGTLLDSETYWTEVPFVMLRHFSVCVDEAHAPWRTTSFRRTLKNFLALPGCPLALSFEECEKWCVDYMVNIAYPHGIPLKPGALEALEALKKKGMTMCLISATEQSTLENTAKRTGILPYFVFVESTEGSLIDKHEPALFETAAKRMGVAPSECLVIEDSLYAMIGAKKAGCTVWAVHDKKHDTDEQQIKRTADRYFLTPKDVADALNETPNII